MFLENIIGNNLYFLVTRNLSDENDDEEYVEEEEVVDEED